MVRVKVLVRHGQAATPTGGTMILHMPLASMAGLSAAAKELEGHEMRRFPIDPAQFWGPRTSTMEYSIALPAGWHAQLPKAVRAASPFGSYESSYTEKNSTLRLARIVTGATAVQPPEKIGDLIKWLRAVAEDDAKFVVLSREAKP